MSDNTKTHNSIDALLLSPFTVFSVDDLAYLWEIQNNQVLWNKINYLNSRGKLNRLSRSIYSIAGQKYSKLELGNKLKTPSYLSFDSILSETGVIYQYDTVYYYASNNSITMEVDKNKYRYRKLKDDILLNPMGLIRVKGVLKASLERAYMDTLYLNPKRYFDNEKNIDFNQCIKLLKIYNKKTLTTEIMKRREDATKN